MYSVQSIPSLMANINNSKSQVNLGDLINENEVSSSAICSPINSISEMWYTLQNPPSWCKSIVPRASRSNTVVDNKDYKCHYLDDGFQNISKRLDSQLVPRTLVCHDMKNGYLEDRFTEGIKQGNGYTFYRWSQIDIFVYFTHHFITIPPLSWINTAHKNGVKILGTFITEWDDGKALCAKFLQDIETMKTFVNGLVDLTLLFQLDGWLLNIENPLDNTSMLSQFVNYFTKLIHKRKPHSLILWYDSIIENGSLKWQNELNNNNRCFFDVCDGIFLNYTWKEENLTSSSIFAKHRNLDVYVGVDVFGRNTYGGGKFNCHIAADLIRKHGMSMAIFAQGWTHETLENEPHDTFFERFLHKDNCFWRSLWPHLYTHPIDKPFETFFYVGADKREFKLHKQETQLSRFLYSDKLSQCDLIHSVNQCNCLQLHIDIEECKTFCLLNKINNNSIHNLFVCDIPVERDVIIYTFTKPKPGQTDFLNLILIVQEYTSIRKIKCNSLRRQNINNYSIVNLNPCPDNRILRFDDHDYIPKDSILRCYHLKFNNKSRILEILAEVDAGTSVILCGIGLKTVNLNI